MPSLHTDTEFLNKDPPWMIALCKQCQELGERTGLTIPGLQTTITVTLTEWLTVGPTSVFHKDRKAEQLSTSHPAAAASKLCRCGTTVTTEVTTVLLGIEAALDTAQLRPLWFTVPEWEALGREFSSLSASLHLTMFSSLPRYQ